MPCLFSAFLLRNGINIAELGMKEYPLALELLAYIGFLIAFGVKLPVIAERQPTLNQNLISSLPSTAAFNGIEPLLAPELP